MSLALQPVINGVNNNAYYNNSASFSVPSAADYDYHVLLDGGSVPTDTTIAGNQVDYHLIEAWHTNQTTTAVESSRVQFIIRSSERGSSDSGLPAWVPYPTIPSALDEFQGGHLRVITPSVFPTGYPIPVVAWVVNEENHALRANGSLLAQDHPTITIKRGVGSGFLEADHPAGPLSYTPSIGGLQSEKSITLEVCPTWTPVAGILNGNNNWPTQSRIQVPGNLTVAAGTTLTIGAGTIVRLNSGINFTNNGSLVIEGTVENPVVFMPNHPSQPWGGFIMRQNTGTITATGTIFTGSGADPNWFGANGNPGSHRDEQALFYVDDDQSVTLTDCAAIYLAGQLGHARSGGQFTFTRFLNQRCSTGGEYTGADFTVNDSAFIEFPDDTPTFEDGDNDGLYLVSGTHGFTNTVIGWTKDDGIDSGGGSAGIFNYQNCWFEANFHEGNSLSGVGKDVRHYDGVFFNNGQGLEDGYDAPTGSVFRCFATGNLIGARFGDNYDWTYNGFLRVQDSILLYNHRDVWGMNWDDWTYRVDQMEVRDNLLSAPNPMHPDNAVWNAATDGWRLAPFRGNATGLVGVGLAIRQRQFSPSEINQPIAVGLSMFVTNEVRVDYRVENLAGDLLDQGTIIFEAGRMIQFIQPNVADPASQDWMRLSLANPVGTELTGERHAYYLAEDTDSNSLIASGATWHYRADASAAPAGWQNPEFDDTAWPAGPAELGFGDNDEATVIPDNDQITSYFRHDFMVEDASLFDELQLWLLRDDGAVVYLNGSEIFRSSNLPAPPALINYGQLAGNQGDNVIDNVTLSAAQLVDGMNVVAVEIHQQSATSSDASFNLSLTGVPRVSSPTLQWAWLSSELVLWRSGDSFLLQHATNVAGPWTTVADASSPWAVAGTQTTGFYRLIKP